MGIEEGKLTPIGAVVETATPAEEGRVVERNFDILPTHIDGFFLLVDHGATLDDFTRGQTRTLRNTGNAYGVRAELIKHLLDLQEAPHKALVDMGINNPGIRGGRDVITGIETQINPETVNVFDESLLDASLGERRQEVGHKRVSVTIEFDPDKEDAEGFIAAVKRRLKRQGYSREEIGKRLKIKRTLRVDEKTLQGLIAAGEVTLIPGTWNTQTKKWDIVPRQIPTRQELEGAEEKARNSQ
ncbi:MAG: hypothetical protein M1444_04570 [Patescibacteria group bacterium]|nr:hypothetical protein [Patescibacteria group bacterium]